MVFYHVDRLEAELAEPPIGDVADIFLDFLRGHAGHRAVAKGQINERIFRFFGSSR